MSSRTPDAPPSLVGYYLRRLHVGARRGSNWLQLVRFGVVGGAGYIVNLAVFALAAGRGIDYRSAAVAAFIVAATNNFLWNRHWTFRRGEGGMSGQALRFLLVSLTALVLNVVLLEALVRGAGLSEIPAQAIAVICAMPVSFVGNKLWAFD
jgi:dolichol-phosphate mannosyltransferase